MASTFASLKITNFRWWLGATLASNIGTWMQRVGQDWVVLTYLTNESGTALGIVTALQFLPFLFLSPYAGILADRLPRRKLLVWTQGLQGVLAIILGLLTLHGHIQLWHIYVMAFLLGSVSAIDAPVRQTFVAELVPPNLLANAVGLNSAAFNGARMIGPGVAGLLVAAVGAGWVFILNGVTFAATIAALLIMRKDEMRELPSAPKAKGQLKEAIAYVRGRTDLKVIMIVMFVVSTFGLNFQVTSALMARVAFGKGAGEFGMVGSVMAIGSLIGALLAARREKPRVAFVLGAGGGFAIFAALSALMPSYWAYVFATIPVGLCSLTMMTAANATIQTTTAPEMRGRVMALYMMVFQGATPIGSPIVGWVGEHWGPRWSVLIGAIATAIVIIAATTWAWGHWGVHIQGRWKWPYMEIISDVRHGQDPAEIHEDVALPVSKALDESVTRDTGKARQ
ncbi:MAG: MFS transporter [Cellulomonadaceae bacterium]|jgi:MFS family permease|nr:MFS transporter [Cellulomonadaceae bacterium]